MHDVPALLIQLQDDLSRSRQREAFWISVVVHLAIVILVVNSTRLEGLMHRRSVILVSPQDLMQQKELTYLELPPDEQKLTKRPDTNNISDKDRIATSKAPQLDRKELKKILDSARPGSARPQRRSGAVRSPLRPPRQAQDPPAPQEQASPHIHRRIRTRWPACRLRPRETHADFQYRRHVARDRPSSRRPAPPSAIAADMAATAATTGWARASRPARPSGRWTFSATPWAWISVPTWRACCTMCVKTGIASSPSRRARRS